MDHQFIEGKFKLLCQDEFKIDQNFLNQDFSKYKEFIRSLKLYSNLDAKEISAKEEEEILIEFFKEIVCIEMLIRENERSPSEEFSIRGAWLLATNEEQLLILQKILGTLYSLRNTITHSLFLPKNNRNFKKIFNKKIVKAVIVANKLHRLILLRHILNKGKIIRKKDLVNDLKEAKVKLRISTPKSLYANLIAKEIKTLTKSKSKGNEELILNLPDKSNCFYWGINSYGGFVIELHKTSGDEQFFYENNVAIIPEEEIWSDLISVIKREIMNIKTEGYSNLKIVSKTHHSVLFYIGYRLYKTDEINLMIDFDGDEFYASPLKDFVETDNYWQTKKFELLGTEDEAIVVLNVNGYVYPSIEEDLINLDINHLPKIELDYMCGKDKIKPNRLCFSNGDEIKKACRSLDLYLTLNEKTRNIQKIHLFTESRGIMMLLLGIHCILQKKDVVLYEYGLKRAEDQERHYYKVISCEYKR